MIFEQIVLNKKLTLNNSVSIFYEMIYDFFLFQITAKHEGSAMRKVYKVDMSVPFDLNFKYN